MAVACDIEARDPHRSVRHATTRDPDRAMPVKELGAEHASAMLRPHQGVRPRAQESNLSTSTASPGVARWEAAVAHALATGDMTNGAACLHPDVIFKSPVVHKPYQGAAMCGAILHAVFEVFDDFTYMDVLDCGDRAGLVFSARVGERTLEGWDYLRFDKDGLITDFTVMVRPMSGLNVLAEAMKAKLVDLGYLPAT